VGCGVRSVVRKSKTESDESSESNESDDHCYTSLVGTQLHSAQHENMRTARKFHDYAEKIPRCLVPL
jgi:hypothetical protein